MSKWLKIAYLILLINYLHAIYNRNNNQSNEENINSTEESIRSSGMICCSAFQNWPPLAGLGPACDPNC